MDYYVCTFNDNLSHKRKYKQYSKSQDFEIWIIDYIGTKTIPDEHTFIVIELLLQHWATRSHLTSEKRSFGSADGFFIFDEMKDKSKPSSPHSPLYHKRTVRQLTIGGRIANYIPQLIMIALSGMMLLLGQLDNAGMHISETVFKVFNLVIGIIPIIWINLLNLFKKNTGETNQEQKWKWKWEELCFCVDANQKFLSLIYKMCDPRMRDDRIITHIDF